MNPTWRFDKGDVFGGLAAMLVAFPSAIAFGLISTSTLGPAYVGYGALAGMVGAIALGLVAALLGGAPRLISAPCAPAAAMLAAFAAEFAKPASGLPPATIFSLLALIGLFAALLQLGFGFIKGGRFIKYIPYPVVAGYMSGVGVIILLSQLPKLLGLPAGTSIHNALDLALWNPLALMVAAATIVFMLASPRLSRAIPAPILALLGGMSAYFGLAALNPALLDLDGNGLVIGKMQGEGIGAILDAATARWQGMAGFDLGLIQQAFIPACMLAVLLSIDTLKTCVVVDTLTRSRHHSNRELIGQGAGNLCAALIGGMPGAGTLGATLINLDSGARSRWSGVMAGVFALAAALLLSDLIAWVPLAALAGILCVIGFRLIDWHSLRLLRQRSTLLDFAVIATVTGTAIAFNLMVAAGVGVALAILLFLREQINNSVVRRRSLGNQTFSKKQRLPEEYAVLERKGEQTVVFELHGALFFGTTDQLLNELEPHLGKCRYLVLDLKRVNSVDFTGAHLLEQVAGQLKEHGAELLLANLRSPLAAYFTEVGMLKPGSNVRLFPQLDDALEWAEDRLLEAEGHGQDSAAPPLPLSELHLFASASADTLSDLERYMHTRAYAAGDKVFAMGDSGDQLFLIRRGSVRIELPLDNGTRYHIASFGPGDFFGEMAFLDRAPRSADAVAATELELYSFSRADFDQAAGQHPRMANLVATRLAHALAERLRQTNFELRALEEA